MLVEPAFQYVELPKSLAPLAVSEKAPTNNRQRFFAPNVVVKNTASQNTFAFADKEKRKQVEEVLLPFRTQCPARLAVPCLIEPACESEHLDQSGVAVRELGDYPDIKPIKSYEANPGPGANTNAAQHLVDDQTPRWQELLGELAIVRRECRSGNEVFVPFADL